MNFAAAYAVVVAIFVLIAFIAYRAERRYLPR
jgi:hypothetical protein